MKRSIYKRISSIEFNQTTARLNVRGSGLMGFWVIDALALISFGVGLYLWIDTEKLVFILLFGGFALFSVFYALNITVYESFEFNRMDPFLRLITTKFLERKEQGEREVKKYLYSGLTIVWEIRRFFNVTSIHIYEDQNIFKLSLPNPDYAALIEWINDSSAPLDTTSKTSLVDMYRQRDYMGFAALQRQLTSLGYSLLVLGALCLFWFRIMGPGLGIVLLIVGGLSLWIKESPLLFVSAIVVIWTIIQFLFLPEAYPFYLYGGYYFFVEVIGLIQEYWSFRGYERRYLSTLREAKVGRAARFFPVSGLVLAGVGFVGYMLLWILVFKDTGMAFQEGLLTATRVDWTSWDLAGSIALAIGVIGFGLSLASLVSNYKPKWAAWAGVVFGSLLVLAEISINIWLILSA